MFRAYHHTGNIVVEWITILVKPILCVVLNIGSIVPYDKALDLSRWQKLRRCYGSTGLRRSPYADKLVSEGVVIRPWHYALLI